MLTCRECGKKAGGFSLRAFNESTGRCDQCDEEFEARALRALNRFRSRLHELIQNSTFTNKGWESLGTVALENGVDLRRASSYVNGDLTKLFQDVLSAREQSDTSDDLSYLIEALSLPDYLQPDAEAFVAANREVAVSCVRCAAGVRGRASQYDYRCSACGIRAVMSRCRHCSEMIQISGDYFHKYFDCPLCSNSSSWGNWNESRITLGEMARAFREEPQVVADPARRKTYGLFLGGSGYPISIGYSAILDFRLDKVVISRYRRGARREDVGNARYSDISSLQIGGRGVITSGGGWIGGGFGVTGIVSGALLASALNQMTTRSSIETAIYFKTMAGELILFNNAYTPEYLRILLSPAFTRIENAHRQPSVNSGTLVDQLRQLGELRAAGTINEDEFQMLKARLIKAS